MITFQVSRQIYSCYVQPVTRLLGPHFHCWWQTCRQSLRFSHIWEWLPQIEQRGCTWRTWRGKGFGVSSSFVLKFLTRSHLKISIRLSPSFFNQCCRIRSSLIPQRKMYSRYFDDTNCPPLVPWHQSWWLSSQFCSCRWSGTTQNFHLATREPIPRWSIWSLPHLQLLWLTLEWAPGATFVLEGANENLSHFFGGSLARFNLFHRSVKTFLTLKPTACAEIGTLAHSGPQKNFYESANCTEKWVQLVLNTMKKYYLHSQIDSKSSPFTAKVIQLHLKWDKGTRKNQAYHCIWIFHPPDPEPSAESAGSKLYSIQTKILKERTLIWRRLEN